VGPTPVGGVLCCSGDDNPDVIGISHIGLAGWGRRVARQSRAVEPLEAAVAVRQSREIGTDIKSVSPPVGARGRSARQRMGRVVAALPLRWAPSRGP
jgi:hypothetical protein